MKEVNDTDESKAMMECTENLRHSAFIINAVLHSKNESKETKKFKYDFNESSKLTSESKNTRRNSQYKTSAIYMIYYIIYSVYHNKKPKNVNFKLSDKKANIIHYETPEGKKKSGPIQHYDAFKNYTYTSQMVKFIDANMKSLIDFGIDEFFKHCGSFLSISLAIKKQYKKINNKKRIVKNTETYNKKRKLSTGDEQVSYSEYIDEISDEEFEIFNVSEDSINMLTPYLNKSIEELKEESRIPSVLMKFYQSWLMECDWECLFATLRARIKAKTCPPAQLRRLLQYSISVVCKHIATSAERELYIENFIRMLKSHKQEDVVDELLDRSIKFKYSQYPVPIMSSSNSSDDIHAYDIKTFQHFARFTNNIAYHMTPQPINLEVSIIQRNFNGVSHPMKIIQYVHQNKHYLFDVIQATGISDEELAKTPWLARLNRIHMIPPLHGESNYINIKLLPITYRDIQFEHIPSGPNVYVYIRTGGLGIGTLFQRMRIYNKESNSKVNYRFRSNNPSHTTRRFQRVSINDLVVSNTPQNEEEEEEKKSVEPIYNNANPNFMNNMMMNPAYFNMMHQYYPSPFISTDLMQQQHHHQQLPYIPNIQYNDNSFMNQLLLQQRLHQPTPTTSPVPSPPPQPPVEFLSNYINTAKQNPENGIYTSQEESSVNDLFDDDLL